MPNNFKLTGNYYVSKAGNDANAGTSPDAPKRTIQGVISATSRKPGTVIIGAGVYSESLSATSDYNMTLLADGLVIIKAPNILSTINFTNNYNSTRNFYATDIIFENFDYIQFSTSGVNASAIQFTNCTFKYSDLFFYWGAAYVYFFGCKFINSNLTINTKDPNGIGIRSIDKCIFINSFVDITDTAGNTFINSYVNSSAYISIPSTIINFNNIQCPIKNNLASTLTTGVYQDTYGRYYDLSIATSTGDGSIGNPYGRPLTANKLFSYSTSITLYPTTNPSGSSLDPKFNNLLKQDFSLQPDSPHIGRASNYIDNIGGTYVATRLDASGSTFSGSNATVDNLVFSFSDYIISGSAVTGSVTSAPIFVSSSAKVIQEIDYNGLLAFNKDTTAPTGSNVNVPDVLTYTSASGQPGANPDRLTYYMRWTTGSSQPVSDAQWENGGLWPAGSFNVFEWNTKPSVDFLGRGNGDQNFNLINTPTFVKATWIQLRVTLRNDYLI